MLHCLDRTVWPKNHYNLFLHNTHLLSFASLFLLHYSKWVFIQNIDGNSEQTCGVGLRAVLPVQRRLLESLILFNGEPDSPPPVLPVYWHLMMMMMMMMMMISLHFL